MAKSTWARLDRRVPACAGLVLWLWPASAHAFDGMAWILTTMFTPDERFGVSVPTEMRERLDSQTLRLVGTATYGRFRSFGISTEVELEGQQDGRAQNAGDGQ